MEKSEELLLKLRADVHKLRVRVERSERELLTLRSSLAEHEAAERVLSSMMGVSQQTEPEERNIEQQSQRFIGLKDKILTLVRNSRSRGLSPEEISDALMAETSVLPSQGSLYGTLSRLRKTGDLHSDGSRWYATEISLPFQAGSDADAN